MIKPDGVQRGLVGKIIERFENRGFQLVAMKLVHAGQDHLEKVRFPLAYPALRRPQGQALLPWSDQVHDLGPRCCHGLAG